MILKAPAKINFRLKVEGLREDGYHLLSMLNFPINLFDTLEISEIKDEVVQIFVNPSEISSLVCPQAERKALSKILQDAESNLLGKAYRAFKECFGLETGLKIVLKKNIPIGAGLGGGSSDAAALLQFLGTRHIEANFSSKTFSLEAFKLKLKEVALDVGADVPFFLISQPAKVGGIGEKVEPVSWPFLKEMKFILVIPDEGLNTKKVYDELRKKPGNYSDDAALTEFLALQNAQYENLLPLIENDLEAPARRLSNSLGQIILKLRSEKGMQIGLSGSGSALFVVSDGNKLTASQLREKVQNALSGMDAQLHETSLFLQF